jgi:hypothetical protein
MRQFKEIYGNGGRSIGGSISKVDNIELENGTGFDYDAGSTDMEKEALSNGARERKTRGWCKAHYLRFNKIMNAYKTARDLELTMKDEQIRLKKKRPDWTLEETNSIVNVTGWPLDKRIMLALTIGNKAFIAVNKGNAVYESTFAESKHNCKISTDSMLKTTPPKVMFYEIFATSENMKNYKLNMVNAVVSI